MLNKIIIIFGVIISFFLLSASADAITAYKTAPDTAQLGDEITVNITIENDGADEVPVVISENFGSPVIDTDGQVIDPGLPPDGIIAAAPPTIEWSFSLSAGETKTVFYKFIAEYLGEIYLQPSVVTAGDEMIETNDLTINVLCSPNGVCDDGEDSILCPEDCSIIDDGTCTPSSDGICDTDCVGDVDPDCRTTTTSAPSTTTATSSQFTTTSKNPTTTSKGTTTTTIKKEGGSSSTFTYLVILVIVVVVFLGYILLKGRMGGGKKEYSDIIGRLNKQKQISESGRKEVKTETPPPYKNPDTDQYENPLSGRR